MKFTEKQLEQAFIELLGQEDIPHVLGGDIVRSEKEVLIKEDLKTFLLKQYEADNLTESEVEKIIRQLETYSSSDLYESNKSIMKLLSNGFALKREDHFQKDIWIYLIDYSESDNNNYKIVNQLEVTGFHRRIPDGILYINGLPVVVIEFKSAIRENTTIYDAYVQITTRYKRDIPELFKFNCFCVISDGVNNKAGSFFAPYEFYYAWRKIEGKDNEVDGIDSLFTLIQGMFHKERLRDIIHNFIYFPDNSNKEEKILCRYPQYYATNKLFDSIKNHQRPNGDGKGGTCYGATGSGKSFTMLFLCRKLMRSKHFSSPTIVLITDRVDLDVQLSSQFTNAKGFLGDDNVESVESKSHLRNLLQNRQSGGVFLTIINKFTEDIQLLTDRSNVICISDEAHRSQINLEQKVSFTEKGVIKRYGFAKYLHDSLPNATYVGFTGTPIDATFDVFGDMVDSYTMYESVKDDITVPIVYQGKAAKVLLNNSKLEEIEEYYEKCFEEGSNEYQIEASKKATTNMDAIIGDPDVILAVAKDFIKHYENRVNERTTIKGKALFVCSNRFIAYDLYKQVIKLRPEWAEIRTCAKDAELSDKDKRELKSIEQIKMVMTRNQDDPKEMYDLIGNKDELKELARQFKNEKSNFKIAIIVDMWLTGFDVPFLDTMYINKPMQKHNLIQTISRVNRKFENKDKGLIVDYIGIKKQMNLALSQFNKIDSQNFEDIEESIVVVKDSLDLLAKIFHQFDNSKYFNGTSVEQLTTLKNAVEFVQATKDLEKRFMVLVKKLKAAYNICSGSERITPRDKDLTHFYLAVRSIIFKLTGGTAADSSQMNERVREMIQDAIQSDGVEEIFKLGDDKESEIDIFNEDYLEKIKKLKLPNTKIKLLQQLLGKAIGEYRKVNKVQGIDFINRLQSLVNRYNDRKEEDILISNVLEEFTDEIIDLYHELKKDMDSFLEMGIDFEEKAFYDILKSLTVKYDFFYADDKLIDLAQKVKQVVDDKAKYTDWNNRNDIKAELKVDLIILLAKHNYPPVDRDEVYKEIFEQAENFKMNRVIN
ncbi:type I restriction endonuclease subunit R [Candidatus Thioglobus sp.]|nr:type I restriction endonuclease subunit R [Candidatus Thioglobus sp.]